MVCVKSNSKLQYNSLGFRRVNHDDDDEFSDDDDDDFFYGQRGPKKELLSRNGGGGGRRVMDSYRDSPSSDEGEGENALFEKRLLKK